MEKKLRTCRSSLGQERKMPFDKIMAEASVKQGVMPAFLRANSESYIGKQEIIEGRSEIDVVGNLSRNGLRIGKQRVLKEELLVLIEGRVERNVLDAVVEVWGYLERVKSRRDVDRVKVLFSGSRCAELVVEGENGWKDAEVERAEIIVLPVFMGYWTVLVLDFEKMAVKYCDPCGKFLNVKKILKGLYGSLTGFERIQRKVNGKSALDNLVYSRITLDEEFSIEESAVVILMVINALVKNSPIRIDRMTMKDYSLSLVRLLLQHGTF